MYRPTRAAAFFSLFVLLATLFPAAAPSSRAQGNSRTFPETAKTVKGRFLEYWDQHGGLPQQGYPISEEMQEKSDTDGKTYLVQYFERAVFELHTENQPPYDVLLSLLGDFAYKQKYPKGAQTQVANNDAGSLLFSETGKRLGGIFLSYWQRNGGLAQQGYPISEEFQEKNDLDGKTYKVQYFERAVFEHHPENGPPYDVLLSQLGTFRYKARYVSTVSQPTATQQPTVAPQQPVSTATPSVPSNLVPVPDCSGIPASVSARVNPNCARAGDTFEVDANGFEKREGLIVRVVMANGADYVTRDEARSTGEGGLLYKIFTNARSPLGIWTVYVRDLDGGSEAIAYFKVTLPVLPQCDKVPASTNMKIEPNCAPAGDVIAIDSWGFGPNEIVERTYIDPFGNISIGDQGNLTGTGEGGAIVTVYFGGNRIRYEPGLWTAIFTGRSSGRKAIGYFLLYTP